MSLKEHSAHTFYIPVMGTGFTLDTPLRVARYGISSVVSLVDDIVIDQMRRGVCREHGIPFTEIDERAPDARARRITAYLDLLHDLISQQVEALRAQPFEPGSDITRYFELLPESAPKALYRTMLAESDAEARSGLEVQLREHVIPGRADVNIMTKLDCAIYGEGKQLPLQYNDAMQALRGFAMSKLQSSLVLSAGINQHLYGYIAEFADFLPDANGEQRKSVVLKVSDFRSALIQGKYLARHGLWVSEYRIESGLNCGGHAFPTKGYLMGPILHEFRERRGELLGTVLKTYNRARTAKGCEPVKDPPPAQVTVQGGVGTPEEHVLLMEHYGADAVGWATPFLLAPDVVCIDDEHLKLLVQAGPDDVLLGPNSPLNVPYWTLRSCASETLRKQRISQGEPGSPCPKHFLAFDTEFTERPICTASKAYQRLKLASIANSDLGPEEQEALRQRTLNKSCICHDLGGSVTLRYDENADTATAVCCGPGIAHFSQITDLDHMVAHIYGRERIPLSGSRPHVFIKELQLYVEHLRAMVKQGTETDPYAAPEYIAEFVKNLLQAIDYYRDRKELFGTEHREEYMGLLAATEAQILRLAPTEAADS